MHFARVVLLAMFESRGESHALREYVKKDNAMTTFISTSNAMRLGLATAMICLGGSAAHAQNPLDQSTIDLHGNLSAGAPGSSLANAHFGLVDDTELPSTSKTATSAGSSNNLSSDTDVSLDMTRNQPTASALASPLANSGGTSVHSSTRIRYAPKPMAVPVGGGGNGSLAGLSADTSNNVVVDTSALPLPVSLPVPVVAIQSMVGTDGVQLSETVGGKTILPPIDLPGLGGLPVLSGATGGLLSPILGALGGAAGGGSALAPVSSIVSSVTGALGGATGGAGPLAPVTGVVSGLTGALGGATGGASPLAPVTGVVSGLTGALGGATGGAGPLAPVTGVVSGLTGALGGATGSGSPAAPLAGVLGKL